MQVIPAIDLRKGRVVRLVHGDVKKETIYHADASVVARDFVSQGATRLHVIDLDGAFCGSPQNMKSIEKIALLGNISLQVGGGIRDLATAEVLLSLGVDKVILGTVAVQDTDLLIKFIEKFGSSKIIIAIDARQGKVAVQGWVESSNREALDFAREVEALGIKEIIYTDILRDGTLVGPNLEALKRIAEGTNLSIIASGGISSLEDILKLKEISSLGITGVITGQALYMGKFTVTQAVLL